MGSVRTAPALTLGSERDARARRSGREDCIAAQGCRYFRAAVPLSARAMGTMNGPVPGLIAFGP